MSKSFRYLTIGLLVLIIGLLAYNLYSTPKIGYVESQHLLYEFEGMKSVQKDLDSRKRKWQANIDTLELELQKVISKLEVDAPSLTLQEGLCSLPKN